MRVPGALSQKTLAVKLVGVTLVVASGLPCGREGPMVQLGAGVASLVLQAHNRVMDMACCRSAHTQGRQLDEDQDTRDFVSMGAAAGVASAFDAPIGGVLFALEEVSTHWSSRLTWLAFFGALVSAVTTKWLTHNDGVIEDEGLFVMWGDDFSKAHYAVSELPIFVLLGVAGGLLGALFNYLNGTLNRARGQIFAHNGWLGTRFGVQRARVVEAIVLAALCATFFFFPPLFFGCSSVESVLSGENSSTVTSAGSQQGTDYSTLFGGGSSSMSALNGTIRRGLDSATTPTHAAEISEAEDFLVDVRCFGADAQYNDMASITLSNQHHVIKALFARRAAGVLFAPSALLLSLLLFFGLSVVVYGAALPSGLFIPCMTIGALGGRLIGELLHSPDHASGRRTPTTHPLPSYLHQ